MSTSRFSGLKQKAASAPQAAPTSIQATGEKKPPTSRAGKKAVVGYFSPAVSKALLQLALDQDTTLQAMLGEAIDDLMRKHGRHPFGER